MTNVKKLLQVFVKLMTLVKQSGTGLVSQNSAAILCCLCRSVILLLSTNGCTHMEGPVISRIVLALGLQDGRSASDIMKHKLVKPSLSHVEIYARVILAQGPCLYTLYQDCSDTLRGCNETMQ